MHVNPSIIGILIAASANKTASFNPLLDVTHTDASWYAADKETKYINNDTASVWTDFGINGRNLGSAGSVIGPYYKTNKINSLPVFEFSASMYLTASSTHTNNFFRNEYKSVFLVFMETNLSLNWREKALMACDPGGGNNDKWIWSINASGQVIWECHLKLTNCDNELKSTTNNVFANTWTIAEFVRDDVIVNNYINGTVKIEDAFSYCYPTSINAPFSVGWAEGNSANTFTGHMAELLFYKDVLSTFDRKRVEGYLAWKYGLQEKLPVSHPYLSAPPTTSRLLQ